MWNRRSLLAAAGAGPILSATLATAPARASATVADGSAAIIRSGRSIEAFGARPDASGPVNLRALRACVAACRDDGSPVLVPAGVFPLSDDGRPITLDLTRPVRGAPHAVAFVGLAGPGQSILQVEGRSGGLRFVAATDWFDPVLEGLGFVGALAGPLVSIGRDDFADPVNMLRIRDVAVDNSFNQGAVTALRLNYLAPGSVAIGLKANAYADGRGHNHGTAIECRQVECMTFAGGAASNAATGFAIRDGVNFGITVQGFTFENTDVAFGNDVATSGAHAVIGCQFSEIRTAAIRSIGCNRAQWIEFTANNFAMPTAAIVDPDACEGIRIHNRHGIATPALPPSGAIVRNRSGQPVQVLMWGGLVHSVLIDGIRMGSAEPAALSPGTGVILQPGDTIGLDYVRAPQWHWRSAG
ncbi:hypothetical protein [Sphingomonas sp. TREG-RG-20F-R18-01]|uniref:hypothetical protein n=1 Tax=Sphingomonas sp. TREG-RG-20F-R18-01 TaxID=2914982 RepID=UPI001F5A1407|nr:hypothetical protein [Sphingomonas sp. TREG-RG-20F-R18-01]